MPISENTRHGVIALFAYLYHRIASNIPCSKAFARFDTEPYTKEIG